MKSEIEQAIEELQVDLNVQSDSEKDHYGNKWKSWYNVRLNTIKQGFIDLEEENKDAVLALEDSMLAIEYFSNKLIEIREVVKEGVHLYETYPGEFHKPEKMYKIKQILDKE